MLQAVPVSQAIAPSQTNACRSDFLFYFSKSISVSMKVITLNGASKISAAGLKESFAFGSKASRVCVCLFVLRKLDDRRAARMLLRSC